MLFRSSRLGRPSHFVTRQQARLVAQQQNLQYAQRRSVADLQNSLSRLQSRFKQALQASAARPKDQLSRANMRLELLNPQLVLQRGYAWLANSKGQPVTQVGQTHQGQALLATLMDGQVDLTVTSPRLI